jgi:hypothetical protein
VSDTDFEADDERRRIAEAALRLQQSIAGIVARLQRDAEDRVSGRQEIEKRWLEDLRQLHGQYEPGMEAELKAAGRSTIYVNKTRTKTNALEARLFDILFPTDDKNWSIRPTPAPELSARMSSARDLRQGVSAGDGDAAQQIEAELAALEALQAQADRMAAAMETEINDMLVECGYAAAMRDVISDACRLGVGVVKGPVARADRTRKSWETSVEGGFELAWREDPRPAYVRVDPWHFFPDPGVTDIRRGESFFERHLMTKKDVRGLAAQPGFDADAVRRLLKQEPAGTEPNYLSDLRSMGGVTTGASKSRQHYQVWEYRGPLPAEDVADLCVCADRAGEAPEPDPLLEVQVCIWFCDGEVLRFGFHHLESDEPIYSAFCLEKDEASPWGYGVPFMMRNEQAALNGAWRMMLDNAAFTVAPQIVINRAVIEPVQGDDWALRPGKKWLRRADAAAGDPGFYTFDIPNHQDRLAQIIDLAWRMMDDATSINDLAQGDQGSTTTQTFGGMALLLNSKNVVLRRIVKNFDDDMTTPCIRRIYDWLMQFSEKPWIKGDMQIDARGSSTLLVREVQATNLMVLAQMTAHPVLGGLLKAPAVLRHLAKAMMISEADIIRTDEEIQQAAEAESQSGGGQDPALALEQFKAQAEMQILQADMQMRQQLAQLDGELKLKLAEMDRQTALIKLAQDNQMSLESLRAKLALEKGKIDSAERMQAAEMGFKDAQSRRESTLAASGAARNLPDGTRFAG